MKNVLPCLFNILKKQPTRAAGKKILPKFNNISKYLYMKSQQQTKKVTRNDIFRCRFFENPTNITTMYSEHSQQLKRSRLQEKFCVADFLIRNICSKTFVFLMSQSS